MRAKSFIPVAVISALVGCTLPVDTPRQPFQPPQPMATVTGDVATFTVGGIVYRIAIAPEVPARYDRDDWPHWDQHIGGGCFTVRDKVLAEESYAPVVTAGGQQGGRCEVVRGLLWYGPYTGMTFTDTGALDIDHLVPLKEAHESGGYAWTPAARRAYANYLGHDDHLVAVHASENRRKGARDPAGYLPPNEAIRCEYLGEWIHVKATWGLTMDRREADAITTALGGCH